MTSWSQVSAFTGHFLYTLMVTGLEAMTEVIDAIAAIDSAIELGRAILAENHPAQCMNTY